MANHNATGKKAKHGAEIVQRTRAAILNTLETLDQRGKKISDILADEAEKNPIKFMELASKYIPKEVNGTHTHQHGGINDLSIDELDRRIEGLQRIIANLDGSEGEETSSTTRPGSLRTIQ